VDQQTRLPESVSLEELTRAASKPGTPAPAAPRGRADVVVIEASKLRSGVELRELWRARELALTLAWRDLKIRYKQSLIGIAWAILQPLLTMVIFTFIFGRYAKFPSQNLPYQVFVYLGLLPWTFFSSALSQIGSCLMTNRVLLTRVYFPRLILPLSGFLVPAADFLCSLAVLFGIMLWFGVHVRATAPLALLFLLLLAVTALGVGSVLATINARYRDVPYAIPFLIQVWLYSSPVIYPTASLPHKWQVLLAFNPVVAAIGGFRWALAGTAAPSTFSLLAGIGTALVLLWFGFRVFRSGEARFVDTV
jgi:lipopolysaccharide transport system permease protein